MLKIHRTRVVVSVLTAGRLGFNLLTDYLGPSPLNGWRWLNPFTGGLCFNPLTGWLGPSPLNGWRWLNPFTGGLCFNPLTGGLPSFSTAPCLYFCFRDVF